MNAPNSEFLAGNSFLTKIKKSHGLSDAQVRQVLADSNQQSDQLIERILLGYFLFGIALCFFYDTWILGIGSGMICMIAYYSTKWIVPKGNLHRYVASGIFAVYVAQYIYQMHGLFEMHFFAFIGTTILITYQNWRLMIPIISLIVVHHSTFAYLQYAGLKEIYFTQLDYMDLQTFIIHAGLAGVVTLISGYWAHNFKQKTIKDGANILELEKQKEEMQAQSEQIEDAHKEIKHQQEKLTSSINYAKRIQDSMLLAPADIKKNFRDLFILFKPRDTVSGDFYFHTIESGKIFLAAVDCTGHGVPGALMSVIGNNLLREIIEVRKVIDPAEILYQLDKGIRQTLQQDEKGNRDGMDLALCVIDKHQGKLFFSGAKNPLVVVRNGEAEKIKGSFWSVGGRPNKNKEKEFFTHEIPLHPHNTYFIFSDGYQDQFSGKGGEKFQYGHMEQIFKKVGDLPGEQQKRALENALNGWMNGTSQIDDVLVVGFKV